MLRQIVPSLSKHGLLLENINMLFIHFVLFLLFPEAVAAETVLGAPMPAFATKVAPFRFRSSQGARATAKALEKGLRGRGLPVEFRVLIDLPDVFALHATSSAPNAAFRGINVSEYGGSVWIFIIPK